MEGDNLDLFPVPEEEEWESAEPEPGEEEEEVSEPETVIIEPDYDMFYNAVYNGVSAAMEADQPIVDGLVIPAEALDYFKGILENQTFPVDYVIYSNAYDTGYEYCMSYGDLNCNGDYFTGTGKTVIIRDNSVSVVTEQTISFQVPYYYSKSNLGDYPGIYKYDYAGMAILISLVIGGLTWIFAKILSIKY